MYVLENTKSVGLAIVGRGIVMDNDKYCEYSFGGFGKSMELSGIIDCTETKGYVYNVKNPEDYAGLFIGGSINLAVGVEGGAIAPALTLILFIVKSFLERDLEVVQEWELHGISSYQKDGYMGKPQLIGIIRDYHILLDQDR